MPLSLKTEIPDQSPQGTQFCEQLKLNKKQQIFFLEVGHQKRDGLCYLDMYSVMDQNRRSFFYKVGMKGSESDKSSKLLLGKQYSPDIVLSNSNFIFPVTNVPNHLWKFSRVPAYGQNSVLNFCRNRKISPFCIRWCTATRKPKTPYDPTKLPISSILHPEVDPKSNCGHNSKKTVSFDNMMHLIDKNNIVT